jgi:hypothetical protein
MVIIIWAAFLVTAIELLLTLAQAYLTFSLGVILLAFGGLRFTAPFAEGYFSNAVRIGVKVLLITGVLAVAMQLSNRWEIAVEAACKPTTTAVPWITSYSVPPTSVMTTVCTGHIAVLDMLDYAAKALVFAMCVIAIPRMTCNLVGGTLGHALSETASALYLSRTVGGAVRSAMRATSVAAGGAASGISKWAGSPAAQQFAAQAAAKVQQGDANATTKALNPFSDPSKPPGYNLRSTQQKDAQTQLIHQQPVRTQLINGQASSTTTLSSAAKKTGPFS